MKQQRKVTWRLTLCAEGQQYDLSQLPGIVVGELLDIEPTAQGLLVSRSGQTEGYLVQPLKVIKAA